MSVSTSHDVPLELLSTKEASQLFNLKESFLRKMIFENRVPVYKIGSLVRFNKHELRLWIENFKKIQ